MACTTCAPVCPWQWEKTTGRGAGRLCMKGPRRREVVHPYICHLPISVFYILFSHVREREDTGEKRGGPCPPTACSSVYCFILWFILLSHVKLCGIPLWLGWFHKFVDICCCCVMLCSTPSNQAANPEVTRVKGQRSHTTCVQHRQGTTSSPDLHCNPRYSCNLRLNYTLTLN